MSQNIVELIFGGNIPAKKNSRINRSDGMSFPSRDFEKWQTTAMSNVRLQTKAEFINPVSIEVIIYFGTDTRADLDNRLTSLLDMFVKCHLLPDDKWQNIPMIALQAEYRKGRPGAFVRITELPSDILGAELAATRAKRKPKKQA